MRRQPLALVLAFVVLVGGIAVAVSLSNSNSATGNTIVTAGRVRAQTVTVRAPLIPALGAGAATQTVATSRRSVSGRIVRVAVTEGQHVRAGQTLLQLDATLLVLNVRRAQAGAAQAHATATATADALDTIDSGQAKLDTARTKLTATLATLRAQRTALAAQLAQLRRLQAAGARAATATSGSDMMADPAALVTRLAAGLKKLDAGIAKLSAGITSLNTAQTSLDDARKQARDARVLLALVADARDVGVDIARSLVGRATITAPASGTVVYVRPVGSLAMTNAPLVRIAPDGVAMVDTYLTAGQIARVHVGQAASIRYDSGSSALGATVRVIGTRSEFAPTWFPTQVVHMTRATKVTLALHAGVQPPAGTPVDVTIRTTSRR